MPRKAVLSVSQRKVFEALPIESESLVPHYTLGEEDLFLIRQHAHQSPIEARSDQSYGR